MTVIAIMHSLFNQETEFCMHSQAILARPLFQVVKVSQAQFNVLNKLITHGLWDVHLYLIYIYQRKPCATE